MGRRSIGNARPQKQEADLGGYTRRPSLASWVIEGGKQREHGTDGGQNLSHDERPDTQKYS